MADGASAQGDWVTEGVRHASRQALTVVIAVDLFSLGSAAIGWLNAVLGVGGLLGGPLAVALVRGRRVARCFGAGVAGWGLPMVLLAFTHAPYWPYLMFAVIGVANVFDDAAFTARCSR